MHKGRIEMHIREILIDHGHYFFVKCAEGQNKAIYTNTMLMAMGLSSNNFIKHLTGLIIFGVFFIFKKTPYRQTVRCSLANKSLNKKKKTANKSLNQK